MLKRKAFIRQQGYTMMRYMQQKIRVSRQFKTEELMEIWNLCTVWMPL